jgi:hypothetical protein
MNHRIGDLPHRGIEYALYLDDDKTWHWSTHAKIESGLGVERGTVRGSREDAKAACRAAIDKQLSASKTIRPS